jgi:hypothetical protein
VSKSDYDRLPKYITLPFVSPDKSAGLPVDVSTGVPEIQPPMSTAPAVTSEIRVSAFFMVAR